MMMLMAAVLAAGVAYAVDVNVSGTADFASAYVWRGITVNDGWVMQPGASLSGLIPADYGVVTFGTWANYDIEKNANDKREFSEVDYYATYALPIKVVDLSATYTEYHYPHGVDTDREVALNVGKAIGETGLYPSLSVNYGVDGGLEEDWYIQGGLGYTKDLTEALQLSSSVKVAYLIDDGDVGGADGFNDATGTLGLAYKLTENWSVKGSVSYIAQLDDEVLTDEEYNTEAVAMLGLACSF
jgi:hypothetical protein